MFSEMLTQQLDVIYLFYGLAHLVLGVVIFMQLKVTDSSRFKLLKILPLLGLFELTHGAHELVDMFKVIKGNVLPIQIMGSLSLLVSYFFILYFGYRLVNIHKKKLGLWFPCIAVTGYLILPFIWGLTTHNIGISARYFLGLPGAVLSACGLILYYQTEQEKLNQLNVKKHFYVTAFFFSLYGVFGGLVVPVGEYFPASIINNDLFLTYTGIPIQFFRTIFTVAIAWSMLHVVNIFNLEHQAITMQTEIMLRDSESRYRTIIENSNDLIWMLDTKGRITYFSKNVEKVTGYKVDELLGLHFLECVAPGCHKKTQNTFEGILAGKSAHLEIITTAKNGSLLTLLVNSIPLKDAGKINGIINFGKDISNLKKAEKSLQDAYNKLELKVEERTSELRRSNLLLRNEIGERKAMEKALKNAHRRFVSIMNSLDALVYVADMETFEVLFVNKYGQDLFGDIKGQICWQTIQSSMNGPCKFCSNSKLIDSAGRPKGVHSWTFQNTSNNEWYEIRDRAIRWSDGRLVRLEIAINITERKRAEDMFRQTSEKFKVAFNNAPIGMTLAANDGSFIQVNKALSDFLGYTKEELLTKTIQDVSHPAELEQNLKYRRKMKSGKIDFFQMEKRYYHKDGHVVWGLLSVSTVRDAKGDTLFMITHLQDITERKRLLEIGEALNDINRAINATLDFETIMIRVVTEATRAIRCDNTSVILKENGHFATRYSLGCQAYIGKSLSREEIKIFIPATDKPLVIEDSCDEKNIDKETAKKHQACAILSVPLTLKDELIGSIVFSNKKPTKFMQPEIDFAQKLAISVSLAVENARIYETEHMIADTLQKALLTVPEQIKGIDFSHMYRSATKAAMVGGDFYDIFEIEDNQIAIVAGDVSGKGIEAAAFTSLVKNTLKAYAYHEHSPAVVMTKTNDVIMKSSPENIFVSVFFAILDKATGLMTYCNAGHPPAIIKRAGNDLFLLKNTSPVLGVFEQDYCCEQEILGKKDMLIIYTDGLIEARRGKDLFTEDRLIELIAEVNTRVPEEMANHIFEKVSSFSDGELSDDLVLMTLALSKIATVKLPNKPVAENTNI